MPPVLIAGAGGFIGGTLARALLQDPAASHPPVRLMYRAPPPADRAGQAGAEIVLGDVIDRKSLDRVCAGVETVFHAAGYAHAFQTVRSEQEAFHHQVNFEGAQRLAQAAGAAGVRRFVFLSSVKAMGEGGATCLDEASDAQPETAYGRAKRAAEDAVHEQGRVYGMHTVCLRLAMTYGPGGGGNLERMAALMRRGLFPPLPETGNRRSLVHVDDVVRAMRHVAQDPRARGQTYIISEARAYSGREIYEILRAGLGLSPCHWAVPAAALRAAGRAGDVLGRIAGRAMPLNSQAVERLLESACYDPSKIARELDFQAQIPLAVGVKYLGDATKNLKETREDERISARADC